VTLEPLLLKRLTYAKYLSDSAMFGLHSASPAIPSCGTPLPVMASANKLPRHSKPYPSSHFDSVS
jgi:hypothetical protein